MDGTVVGSVTSAELHLDSDASEMEVECWFGLVSLKMSYLNPFGVENGHKTNSQTFCQFLEDTFLQQWRSKNQIYVQENATHRSTSLPGQLVKAYR